MPPRIVQKNRLRPYLVQGRCEGPQEELYFKRLQRIINAEERRKRQANLLIKSVNGGDPYSVVLDASRMSITAIRTNRKYHVAVFDNDFKNEAFINAIDLCKETNIFAAYSNVCFDLWLLLHKSNTSPRVTKTDGYTKDLREAYGLSRRANVKKIKVINSMMKQIEISDVRRAIRRAHRILNDNQACGDHRTTSRNIRYYNNPDLTIHFLIEEILNNTGV